MKEERLVAVMTDQLPAPKFSIEMNSCNCKKTQCVGNRCSCSRNGLRCTELCKCVGCENEDLRFDTIDEEETTGENGNVHEDNCIDDENDSENDGSSDEQNT